MAVREACKGPVSEVVPSAEKVSSALHFSMSGLRGAAGELTGDEREDPTGCTLLAVGGVFRTLICTTEPRAMIELRPPTRRLVKMDMREGLCSAVTTRRNVSPASLYSPHGPPDCCDS